MKNRVKLWLRAGGGFFGLLFFGGGGVNFMH